MLVFGCVMLMMAGSLTACLTLPTEAEMVPPPVFALVPPREWFPREVQRGDVRYFAGFQATAVPARQEHVRFTVANVRVEAIHVYEGDEVREGDIIATLYRPDIVEQFERETQNYNRMRLNLDQINAQFEFQLSIAEQTGQPVDDTAFLARRDAALRELEVQRALVNYLAAHNEGRFIRAGMDGVITHVTPFNENLFTAMNWNVATISDLTHTIFLVTSREAELIEIGDRFELQLPQGNITVEAVNPAEYGVERLPGNRTEAFLMAVDDIPALPPDTHGRIELVFDEALDVLFLHRSLVRSVPGREGHFVYILVDGLRELREVVVGLQGNNYVEIVSGLQEGDLIV